MTLTLRTLRTAGTVTAAGTGLLVALGCPALAAPVGAATTSPTSPTTSPTEPCDPLRLTLDATVTAGAPTTASVTLSDCSPLAATYVVAVSVTAVPPLDGVSLCPDGPSFRTLVSLDAYASRTFLHSGTAPTCAGTYHVAVTSSLLTGQVVASEGADITVVEPAIV